MKSLLKIILLPFSLVYGLIIFIRNSFYNLGFIKPAKFNNVIISVGNLSVGGTGKTPHIEYLIQLLKTDFNIATLSRGYKRKTKGFILASDLSTANDIGDEPLQYFKKHSKIKVAVDKKRVNGVKQLLKHDPNIDTFLLDDAYQHRSIDRNINILITDYNKLYTDDWLMPSGTLREWRCGSKRADIIIVSKTPEIFSESEQNNIINKLNPEPHKKIYFSYIKYGELVPFTKSHTSINPNTTILTLSGIANPTPFIRYIKNSYNNVCDNLTYPDHHPYSISDILKVIATFEKINTDNKAIITTEKDIMRLYLPELKEQLKNIPIFYVPIEVCFHGNGKEEFDNEILNYVRTNSRN